MTYSVVDDVDVGLITAPAIIETWELPMTTKEAKVCRNLYDFLMGQIIYHDAGLYEVEVFTYKAIQKYPDYETNLDNTKDFLVEKHKIKVSE